MKILFIAFLFLAFHATAQTLQGHSLSAHVDPELGSTTRGGAELAYQSPWKYVSAHMGWSHVSSSFGDQGPTGWLDLGASIHPAKASRGFHPGLKAFYSLGLRDGSGWMVKICPTAQFQTQDDNILSATVQVETGSEDLWLGAIADWQWGWDHFYVGPRLGLGFTSGKPIIGATAAYRL